MMKKFKNWLIKLLGGVTKDYYKKSLQDAHKCTFTEFRDTLETRVRGGNTIFIVVSNRAMFRSAFEMFNPSMLKDVSNTKQSFTVGDYNFKVVAQSDWLKLRGYNLAGYFLFDGYLSESRN